MLSEIMKNKSYWDLKKIVDNPADYTSEEIQAAWLELEERGHFENYSINKSDKEITEKVEILDEEYPKKPEDKPDNSSIQKSLISIVLFIAAFMLIFKWDIWYILILAGVILLHELGHFLAMKIFKYTDLNIFFIPFLGAYASGSKDKVSQKQQIIILLAGPVPGIILGVFFYYYGLTHNINLLLKTSNLLILINLFNLLPVYPLDGGKLIKCLFFESNEIINKIFIFLSIAFLTYISVKSQSYILLIIPIVLAMQLSTQSQIKKVKEGIKNKGIDLEKSFNELTDKEYWLIRDEIALHMKTFGRYISPRKYIISSKESLIIKQIKAIIQYKSINDLNKLSKVLITFVWILIFIIPFVVMAVIKIKYGS